MSEILAALATDAHPRQVFYDDLAPELLRQFFGRPLSAVELANLVGALDDSVLLVEGRSDRVFVQCKHPKVKAHDVFIARNSRHEVILRIDELEFFPFHRGQREGVKMLLRQVNQARKLGLTYLEAEADGNARTFPRRNGYYVWARFGFSALLSEAKVAVLPAHLKLIEGRKTQTLSDLMLNDGHHWWRENGEECFMLFILDEGGKSLQVFEKYVLELVWEGRL